MRTISMRVTFAEFCIEADRRQLTCDGDAVHLTPKAFDLLSYLIEQRPKAVTQDKLFDHLWPDTLVDTDLRCSDVQDNGRFPRGLAAEPTPPAACEFVNENVRA